MADQPSFSGELAAMFREGAKDLHNAIVPAFPESQRGVDEPGTPMAPTQMQVNQDLGVSAQAEAPAVEGPQVEAPQAEASSQIEAPQPSFEQALSSAAEVAPPVAQQEMQMEM